MIILGVVLAIAGVGIVGAVVVVAMSPKHRTTVPLIDQPPSTSSTGGALEDDAGGDTKLAPAPTLSSTDQAKHLLPKSDGGGTWDPCASLKRARERDAGATQIANLEAKCRQAGGTP